MSYEWVSILVPALLAGFAALVFSGVMLVFIVSVPMAKAKIRAYETSDAPILTREAINREVAVQNPKLTNFVVSIPGISLGIGLVVFIATVLFLLLSTPSF